LFQSTGTGQQLAYKRSSKNTKSEENYMKNIQTVLGVLLLVAGASTVAMASVVPEIAPGTAGSAVALVSGIVLMIRGRRK
jgi:hypothetical protein